MKRLKAICLFSILLLSGTVAKSQNYNFGQKSPQTQAELPKSKAPFQKSVRVAKTDKKTILERINTVDYRLTNGWELADSKTVIASDKSIFAPNFTTSNWYNATVPGTVLTTLVDQGVYPDPYWGLNNLSIPDSLCRTDWWYRIAFVVPQNEQGKRVFLRLDGINYKAEVWVNRNLVGTIAGAFSRGSFDITTYIKASGDNILAIRILPPNNPGIPQEQNSESHGANGGVLGLDGSTFISSEGWDWMPGIRDRNIGIWQNVYLSFRRDIEIRDPQVITDLPLPNITSAKVTVNTEVVNHSDKSQVALLELVCENIKISKEVTLAPNEVKTVAFTSEEYPALILKNPRLWWPNGYGKAELYDLSIVAKTGDQVSDKKDVRFGVREFEYELSLSYKNKQQKRVLFNPIDAYAHNKPVIDNLSRVNIGDNIFIPAVFDETNRGLKVIEDNSMAPYITMKVNGQPIFCKGGNWGI